MKERVNNIIGGTDAHNLWMGTFHSVFAKFYVMKPNTSISPQTLLFMILLMQKPHKKHYKEQNLDKDIYKPNVVYSRISQLKNALISHAG